MGSSRATNVQLPPEEGMERFRIELGSEHGIKPANIVGAIANEGEINSRHIGRIAIYDSHSTVDLPCGMPDDILRVLHKSRVGSKTLKLQRMIRETADQSLPARRQKPEKRYGSAAGKGRKKSAYDRPTL